MFKEDIHFIQDLLRVLIIIRDLILSLQHGSAELRRESLGDLHGLADPRALDDNILNLVLLGQTCHLSE